MTNFPLWLAVAGGGALGATARFGVSVLASRVLGPAFPWGTLAVNIIGCFVMGIVVHWLAGREPNPMALRAFLAIGMLGGFTTFSAFALDVVTLYRDKTFAVAAVYLLASVILSVGGLLAGLAAGRALL